MVYLTFVKIVKCIMFKDFNKLVWHALKVTLILITLIIRYNEMKTISLKDYLLICSFGWKSTSFTLPLWPGNLYNILRVLASQIYTNRSAEPAETFEPSGDHAHRNKFCQNKIFQ